MKTFETEKNNIPKGATHYWNESCRGFFAWWNDNTKEMLCPDGLGSWCRVSDVSDDILHEIPKPRTKIEFVKCEFLREWEAVRYYNEDGELFVVDCNGNYTNVNDISGAWYEVVCKNYHNIYRQVETEIDERQEFIDVIEEHCHENGFGVNRMFLGSLYDSGKFKLVEK
ncbi:hypothetical protein NVP1278O_79 [Vibrio phage 1.278.O._10N.286.54.E8]|nr:hypothetical protein NVP1278O_79 [Vibrio phage 1.278.O._10N.286.54.E8]